MSRNPVENFDDDRLVSLAQDGDRYAFETLVRRHQNGVFTLALRLVGDRSLAADVSQDAFVRAWRGLPGFRGDARFSTWLYRITVNTAWTAQRKGRRDAHTALDDVAPVLVDGAPTPEEAGATTELRAALAGALGRLPEKYRAVVVLKDVYGWPHEEISAELGISVTAAKVRLHRARQRLREMLDDAS